MNNLYIETHKGNAGWLWLIDGRNFSIDGQIGYKTKKEAKNAAYEFIVRCLTDRETWPKEYK